MYSKYISIIHRLGDIILLNISFIVNYFIIFGRPDNYVTSPYFSLQLYLNLTWIITSYILNTYNIYRVTRITNIINNFFRLFIIHFLLTWAFIGFTESILYSKPFLLLTYLFIFLSIPLWRIVLIFSLKAYRKSGYNFRNVIIAGYDEIGKDLREFFTKHPEHGYRFMGFFDDRVENNSLVLGNIDDIKDYAVKNDVDEIYCSVPELKNEQVAELIDYADNNLIRIKFLPQSKGFNYRKLKIDFYDHLPVLLLRPIPLDEPVNKFMKRSFDIFFSLIVIIFLLSWLIPLFAIMIKADSRGPVFFKQKRSGINNTFFRCWKLRTMFINPESDSKQAIKNDMRITSIGKHLRKYSIDELPQFFNVLMGNMSLVGPRPHMIKHTEEYSKLIDKYMVRHFVKPGITGLSQIKGYRGETFDSQMMKNRVRIDIFYIENWSFLLDLKIIFMTVMNLLKGEKDVF